MNVSRRLPAINTSSIPTSVAVMLLYVHCLVADEACCAFVRARLYNVCSIRSGWVWQHQAPGYRNAEAAILGLKRFNVWLHEVRTSV